MSWEDGLFAQAFLQQHNILEFCAYILTLEKKVVAPISLLILLKLN